MFNFIMGIIIGTAFAPMWMKVWAMIKETELFKKAVAWFTAKRS